MAAPKKADKGKARTTESPPETFESAGTDLEDPYPGPSSTTIPRVVSNRGDVFEEQEQEDKRKPPPKKRGRPRKDEAEEERPSKRGKTRKADDEEVKGSTKSKSKRQAKKSSSKPKSTVTKSKTRKRADTLPDMSDVEKEEYIPSETKTSGSNARKRQRRTLDDGSSDEKQDEPPGGDEPNLNPDRLRFDSIPPEGVVIRKKNGIVERLLPPVMYVQLRCLRLPMSNLPIAVNLRGRFRVIGGRLGALVNELSPLMF